MPGFHHRTTPDASGTKLLSTEWGNVLSHEADSQVANDMLYFDGTNWLRGTPATIWAILDSEALDDTPVNGETTEGITSNWAYGHDADASAHHAKYTDSDARTACVEDAAYGAGWNGDTTHAPTQNAVYDKVKAHEDNASAHHAAYSAPARSFWVFPHYGVNAGEGAYGDYERWLMDAGGEAVYMSFGIPTDFSSLTTVKLVFIEKGTSTPTIDWTITTDFGADGESYNNHSDSVTADGQALVADELEIIDISAAFTGLATGDFVGVTLAIDAVSGTTPGIYFIGLEFKYAE